MKDNIFGSEAFILLTKMEMHYRRNEFQNFLQNLALDAHDGPYQKSTLAFIRHCSRVGGNDILAIDKGGNLPEKVENHCYTASVSKYTHMHIVLYIVLCIPGDCARPMLGVGRFPYFCSQRNGLHENIP